MRKRICVMQDDIKDCGVSCLLTIIKYYHGDISKEYLREITKTTKDGVSAFYLVKAAQELGFSTKAVKGNIKLLEKGDYPLIAHVIINNSYQHFVVVYEIMKEEILIADPSLGIRKLSINEWNNISTEKYFIFKPLRKIPKYSHNKRIVELIISYLLKYKLLFVTIFLFSLIYTLLNIITSYNLKLLVNNGDIYNSSIKLIFWILIILGVIKNISSLFRNKLINYININLDKTLFNDIYNHIISLPYQYYKNRTCGDIITRINDIANIKELMGKVFLTLFVDLLLMIFVLIMLFKISRKLTIITMVISIIYIIIMLIYNKLIHNDVKKSYKEASNVNSYLVETISSIDTIKGMNVENTVCNKIKSKYNKFLNINKRISNNLFVEEFFKEIVYYFGNLLIIYLGIDLMIDNKLSLMNLITYISLFSYYFEPIRNIADLNYTLKNCLISIKRVVELYNIPKEEFKISEKSIITELKGNIKFINLSYSYNGINDILKNVNLEIKTGEKCLIYGGSGKGKSTLVKFLIKYLNDYDGNIYIDNRELKYYDLTNIRERICYVSQNETLFTDSIYHNIVFNRDIEYDNFLRMCKLMRVNEFVESMPLGYDTLIEENGFNLSSGERQRIILARTLLKKADIYIFDEALNAIDIKYERIIIKNIFRLLSKKTVIVISHRFNNEDLFDRKINMEDINEC